MYDITIVGGGPTGTNLARLLGNKYKILLIEKRNYDNFALNSSHKCCGGLVDPDAQKMLAKFNLGIPKSVLISPQLFSVRTIDIDNSIERYYQRHYINIDRTEFDKWLQSLVPANVEIINNCIFKGYENLNNNELLIKYHFAGKEYTAKTKMLIGADGAFSSIRKQAFINSPTTKLYISIQEWFKTDSNLNYYGAIFDSQITDFYSWSIPKEDYLIIGSALNIDGNVHKKFSLLKEKLKTYGYHLGIPDYRNGAFIARPVKTSQICTGNNNIALVGEAAGFISPSSAEGLSYALKSSLALAKSLQNGFDDYKNSYCKNLEPLIKNILFKNLKSPAMYNKYIRGFVMKSGLMSIDVEE